MAKSKPAPVEAPLPAADAPALVAPAPTADELNEKAHAIVTPTFAPQPESVTRLLRCTKIDRNGTKEIVTLEVECDRDHAFRPGQNYEAAFR